MKKLTFSMLLFFLVLSQCDSGYSQYYGGYGGYAGFGQSYRFLKTPFLIQSLLRAK